MARPLRIAYPGAFYHIASRGNERKAVFKSKQDRVKVLHLFQDRYKSSQGEHGIGARRFSLVTNTKLHKDGIIIL